MPTRLRFSLAVSAVSLLAHAAHVFVAPDGTDANPGTLERPFRTIQKGVATLQPGDTCFVRGGVYRETITLVRSGTEGEPVRIRAYPGESVTLDGTEPLTGTWTHTGGGVFSTKTDITVEQLFAGDTMLVEARWPNCPLERILTRDGWATAGPKSEYRRLRDPELANTGIDWNGAMAILNVAHQFWSWSRTVEGYTPGSDLLPYTITMNPFHTENRNWWHDDYYYLVGKREALDVPGEWHRSPDGTLSVIPPAGADPAAFGLRAKQRHYGFVGKDLTGVVISGFQFFACSFSLTDCEHCVVEHCNLLYPSYARGVPNAEEKGRRKPCPGTTVSGKANSVRSCSFEHCPNYGVVLRGERNLIENCLIHDVNWTGTLHYTALALRGGKGIEGPANVARGNTLYNVGNTIVGCSGPFSVVEYNHIHHGGLISSDVSLIYTSMPSANGLEFRYNWVHDSLSPNHSLGIRGDDKTRGLRVHHNVVWNVAKDGIVTKGGRNRVYNNTCFANGASDIHFNAGPEPDKWWQKHVKAYQQQNEDSLLINNCAPAIVSTRRPSQLPLPGDHSNNFTKGDPMLRELARLDFRPRAGSPLIDAGRAEGDITAPFVGKAPDIGAYEHGGEHWLPGHRNGVWLSRPDGDLLVRLDMPILDPVQLGVRAGTGPVASIEFTSRNWARPQPLPATASGPGSLVFESPLWGNATVEHPNRVRALEDARAMFAKPDLASARHVDSEPKYDYEHSYTTTPVALPAFRAYFTDQAPTVDGVLGPDEWPGWDVFRSVPLMSLTGDSHDIAPAGQGYVLYDGQSLYIAARITATGDALVRQGGTWGPEGSGGIEVDLATFSRRRVGPVFVLHGYPSGKLESVTDGGATAESAERFGRRVTYRARVLDDRSWTCEVRMPLGALGVDVSDIRLLRFNLGLRRNGAAGGPWFAAVKTGGANYALDRGSVLHLSPVVRADAANLLVGADFESGDTAPWRLSTNRPEPAPEGTASRVRMGARGDWCVQLAASDPEAMKERVFKWTHPVGGRVTAPGRYRLSYDLRIVGRTLRPRDKAGSFNSYVHVLRDGRPGGNLGQRESTITSTGDRWIRREVTVNVPSGVTPTMVSLQLHRATGTVLVDNVSLLPSSE